MPKAKWYKVTTWSMDVTAFRWVEVESRNGLYPRWRVFERTLDLGFGDSYEVRQLDTGLSCSVKEAKSEGLKAAKEV